MLKALFHFIIRRFERTYDYDSSYMHALVDLDPRGFWQFSRVASAAEYRAGLPLAAFFAAKLAATLHEDCGPCAQLVIKMALAAKVPAASLTALVRGDDAGAGPDAAIAFRFCQAVLQNAPDLETWRTAVLAQFGPRGPAFLGLTLCLARMFPVLKRAMGHAHTCSRLDIDGVVIAPNKPSLRAA